MVVLKSTLKEQNIVVLLISLRGCSSIMRSVAEEPQKHPLAQMGGGVLCNHAIKEGGEGRKTKPHFCSQGGSGCRVVEGGKIYSCVT